MDRNVLTGTWQNCEYEVVSGGQRKVEDYNAEDVELVEFMDDETRERINQDPMFALELRGEDKRKVILGELSRAFIISL